MTAPRAFTRTISDAMRRTLQDLGNSVSKEANPGLFSRIGRVLQDDTASEQQAVALIEQARRATGARPNPDAATVAELARRTNPNVQGRTSGWDPSIAKETRKRSAVATVLEGVEQEGGGTPVGGASTPESRAAAREAKSKWNRDRAEKRRQDIAALGKNPDPAAVKAIDDQYDADRTARVGGSARSIAAQSGAIGTGPKAEAKTAAAAARSQVNTDLRAGKIDAAEAESRYAIIKQQENWTAEELSRQATEGDLTTHTKVGDAQDIRDGRYYDLENPEAKDRPDINGRTKPKMRPGGLNERVVTAAAVVRRHINEMISRGEIPASPPDAAMPTILRTAMKEMGTDDAGFDDHALMRAYRQQARRGSAFSKRRESSDPADLPNANSIDEAGERAGLKMLEGRRSGVRRQDAEEGFVDDAAAMLAEGDAIDESYVTPAGPTGRQLARATQEASMVSPPRDATTKQLDSFRRVRGRAARQAGQFDRMDEGAGEYALERNEKLAKRRAAGPGGPVKPREFFVQDELGPVVQPKQAKSSIVPGAGQVRQSTAPGRFLSQGVGGELAPENMRLRERSGEREQVFPRRGGVNRFTGMEPVGAPTAEPRMGRQGPNYAAGGQESPEVVMREVQDENTALLAAVESGQLSKEEAAGYMMDNMRRVERVYTEMGGQAPVGRVPADVRGVYEQEGLSSVRRPDTGQQAFEPSEFAARREGIEGQANQDIDGLVRMLMERVSRMPQGEQDQFFALPPRGLDQQLMLNRDRSRTMRETMRPEVDYRGEPLDIGRPGAVPFPSGMQKQFPQDQPVESIIAQILEAINAGR